uniref:Anthocyanin 5-aromatic acyltransferase n=1 Tax=Triticum urartu TaxID=4572 RepID=A0A8R7U301_TRIUA
MRRGLAIGMAVHHTACDGGTSTGFLHTWAAASTGAVRPPRPVINRTLVKDPTGLYDVFVKAKPTAGEMDHVKTWEHRLLATFTLSKDDIQRVKDVIASEAAPPRCSSLVATFGFMWSCHQRAKDAGSTGGDPTYLLFPVDHRSRMKPPVPDEYLGNCVGIATHAAPMDRLAAAGAGGLFVACTAIAAAVKEAVRGIGSPKTIALWMHLVREAGVAGMWTVAGSPRFRVYEVDFGFGRPAKMKNVSVARTGAMAVAEGRSSRGGIEVGISLPAAGMQSFQKCFQDAIDWLHQ